MKEFSPVMKRTLFCFILFFVIGWANAQSDTLNRTDTNGKKQGYWIIYGKDKPGSGYADTSIVEEGNYIDHRKNGTWKKYHLNGKLKLEGVYKNNRPWGSYKKYYEIGVLQERATWKQNKYVDSFFRYYENKQLQQQKFFNENGKQEGWSIYYLENGEIEYKGYFINGIEIPDSTHRRKKDPIVNPVIKRDPKPVVPIIKGVGYQKKYNANQELEYDGEFKDGELWNGKHYIYDKDGILLKIEIYKNGKYVGDGQLD